MLLFVIFFIFDKKTIAMTAFLVIVVIALIAYRIISRMKKKDRKCDWCGKDYNGRGIYCSRRCQEAAKLATK